MVKKQNITFQPTQRLKYKPIPNASTPNPTTPPTSTGKKPRLAPILLGGAFLYVTATYVSMIVFKSKQDTTSDPSPPVPSTTTTTTTTMAKKADGTIVNQQVTPKNFDTSTIWGQVADRYDDEIGWDEKVMGIGLLRRWLVGQAKGDVLEVSTGTGRNFDYYKPAQVASLTLTDDHPAMLNAAQSKFTQYHRTKFHDAFTARFDPANVESLDRQAQKYDTVVDTFGLCSCGDPGAALISMADACKSEESRILLLEHGRSHYDWLNRLLDTNVDQHVKKWGCWWNRSIMDLFEEERVKEKLEVVSVSRWHFGTTCYVVAKPKKS